MTRAHKTYYREELRDVDDSRIILQTLNRVTGVAVAGALLHILQRDNELKRVRDYLHHLFLRLLIRMPMSFEIERLVSWENAVVRRVRTRLRHRSVRYGQRMFTKASRVPFVSA